MLKLKSVQSYHGLWYYERRQKVANTESSCDLVFFFLCYALIGHLMVSIWLRTLFKPFRSISWLVLAVPFAADH